MSISSLRSTPISGHESQLWRANKSPRTSIHNLDDDSLLHIFYLFRPSIWSYDEFGGIMWAWPGERWWYKLAQVCRRWRYLVLGAASRLRLCLLCTAGTPVADMLAHSPLFPLIICYDTEVHNLSAEDEEGMMLALGHHNRVQCIFLRLSVPSLQKFIPFIGDEFPALEYLHVGAQAEHHTHLTLPPTFEAPHLRILELTHFASPIGSPLLSIAIGLVTLGLVWIHPSAYPHPNEFLEQLSLLPQLEIFYLQFRSAVPNRAIERQSLHTPVMIHVTHHNLRVFDFVGVSAFLEAVLPHMVTPRIETFKIAFFNQLTFSVPHLPTFMTTTETLRFNTAYIVFHHEAVVMSAYSHVEVDLNNFNVTLPCKHLDWQVFTMAQISTILSPLFSDVVDLLDYRDHMLPSEWHTQADRTWWRVLLGSFRNIETLHIHNGLVGEVSRSIWSDGEPPLDVLPELKVLVCPSGAVDNRTFAPFIHEREVAGQPVNLIGDTFPVGRSRYCYPSSTGVVFIEPDPDPLP